MDKLTYLAELAEGLARWVPERERQNILRYYAEYFEEAGPEREAEVVAELGDPWALSCRLAVEGGFVTSEQAASWTPPKKKKWPWIVLGAAAVLVFVIGSVATAAMRVGSFVGRNVASFVTAEVGAEVVEQVDGALFGSIEMTEPPVAYAEASSGIGFWTMEDGCLEAFDAIDAEISFGRVSVTTGDDYTLFINCTGNLGGYSLKWEVKGGKLKITDASDKGFQMNLSGLTGEHSVSVDITVPGGVELDEIKIKTALGDVFLNEIWAETKVEAKSNLGNVECYGLRAPKVKLESDLGDVFLIVEELQEGMEIDLGTHLGQVEANLSCMEQECEYELECSLGTVCVNGWERGSKAERKGSCLYKLEAESDLGDVNVYFTAD